MVSDTTETASSAEQKKLLHLVVDLLFDAIAAFQTEVRSRSGGGLHHSFRWRAMRVRSSPPSRLAMRSHCASTRLSSAGSRQPVAVAAPGVRRAGGSVGRRAFRGWPFALVLAPHPAGLCYFFLPILCCGLLFGCDLSRRSGFFLGKPPRAGRRKKPSGCASRPGRPLRGQQVAAAILVVPAIWVVIWRHVGVTGPVGSHRTSPPSRSAGRYRKYVNYRGK